VYADIKRLRQVLVNLLGNAIKFTDQGSVALRVVHQREIVRFEVEDTGVGIPQDEIDRIFLPFERTSGSWIRGDTGTGLGLPITKLLTELMGGEISVVSTLGRGSTFTVRIYLPEVTSPTRVGVPGRDVIGFAGPPRTVLIVDDQAVQRQLLAEMLTPIGFQVIEAATGEACLRETAAARPDAILLDISMPGMDGWETCRRIKSGTPAACSVIMVTASMADNIARRKADSGCDDFIGKPVMESELLEKLRLHLGLEWRFRALPVPTQTAAAAAAEPLALPPGDYLKDLLRLGQMGYVKGIHHRLDELERLDPGYAGFVRDLRALVKGFRLEQYTRLIMEHMRVHATQT
jgi:CheY-like chemotaxis protein